MRRLLAICVCLMLSVSAAHAYGPSSVNPQVPANNSPLTSSVVRGNFGATYNDITNIYSILNGFGPFIHYGTPLLPQYGGTGLTTIGTNNQVLTSNGTSLFWGSPSGGGAVSSVFSRTGAVTAQTGDYSFSQISGTASLSTQASGTLQAAQFPALTGDITTTAGSLATTLATVNTNTGSFGSSTSIPSFTVNGKGLITAASGNVVIAPAGTLSGTTLASNVVTSSLTSVGTLGSLTVSGTTTLSGISGSTQCLHVNSSGVVTGTGSDCGSSGGGVSITAGNAGIVASPSPITGTGTISLGVPTASTLGGVESLAAVTHNFLTSISTSGVPTQAQPAFTDISGTCTIAQGCTGATALTQGSVVFAGASGVYSQNNANFFWDNTNARLGVGTTIPAAALDVNGQIIGSTGSATTTTYGYRGSTNYGWYMNGTDQRMSGAGSDILRISSAGTFYAKNTIQAGIINGSVINTLGVNGGASIGTNYIATAAPTNGLIVVGSVGIGTSAPTTILTVIGTATATNLVGAGSGITTLNASNLSSGTVPTAQLGSGTANSSTFLRGDQTWATPLTGISAGTAGQFVYYPSSGSAVGPVPDMWFALSATYNISQCIAGTFPPPWCAGSTEPGQLYRNAETAIGTQSYGRITTNPGATLTQTSTANLNTYSLFEGQNTLINCTTTTGVCFTQSGGNPQGTGSPGWPGAGMEHVSIAHTAGYTGGNTNTGLYLGGDPTSTITPTGNYSAGLVFRDIQIYGFNHGIDMSGNNAWANTFDHVSVHENNENWYVAPTLTVISAWAITATTTVNFTVSGSTIAVGQTFTPEDLTTGSFMNGATMTAITGTTSTNVRATFPHANTSSTEFGTLNYGATNSGEMSHIIGSDIFDATDCGMSINAYYDWAISDTNFDYNPNGGICGQGIFKLSNVYFEQENAPIMNFNNATILDWVNGGIFLNAGSGTELGYIYDPSNDPTFNNLSVRNVVISGAYNPVRFIYTNGSSLSLQELDWQSIVLQTGGSMVPTDATNANLIPGTTNVYIGSAGNIGIGTQTPRNSAKLDVNGGLNVSGSGVFLTGVTTGTNADFLCRASTGQVLLQTSACTISKRILKENFLGITAQGALDDIMRLKPTQFNFKPTVPANPDPNAIRTQYGFIADEVAAVDPKLAIYDDDMVTPKSYRQEAIIALLVKGMQAQQEELQNSGHSLLHRCVPWLPMMCE